MIYLDQAATSFPKPQEVMQAMVQALQTAGNSGRGAHSMSLTASRLIFEARVELANFFGGVQPQQIAFTSNATESLNLALFGLLRPGDHVITTDWEHNSVLRPLSLLEKEGVELSVITSDQRGVLDLAQLESLLRPNTRALVCTHASNVTGNVLDLAQLSIFCELHNLCLIVDGAQTAGAFPLNLADLSVDVFCFTGHKSLCGPQGVGGIYVRPGLELKPLKVGGSGSNSYSREHPREMPEALEAGTLNVPGIAGLLASVRYLQSKGVAEIYALEQDLARYFYQKVCQIPKLEIYGDFSTDLRCPIISININNMDASLASQILAEQYGVYTRAGAHCAPLIHQALGTETRGTVRFSIAHLNSYLELDQALEALKQLCY